MRLWHEALIPVLSDQRLLGQHRECCALRGKGWGKKHSTVDYVFKHDYSFLYLYHMQVMMEMEVSRKFKVNHKWLDCYYRGESAPRSIQPNLHEDVPLPYIYPEHNDEYLEECKDLLRERGDDKLKRSNV